MKITFKHLEQFANSQGLTATRYQGRYKIHLGLNVDYFQDHLERFNTMYEAYAFVQGIQYANYSMKILAS